MKPTPLVSLRLNELRRNSSKIRIALFGSTGSIGQSTLRVSRELSEFVEVEALCAGSQIERLFEQVREWKPKRVAVSSQEGRSQLQALCKQASIAIPEISVGAAGLAEIAHCGDYDIMVSAILGLAGLESTLIALDRGKRVALANKESLVAAGHLFPSKVEQKEVGAEIIPVDSEHSALYQLLLSASDPSSAQLFLTASGGPFLRRGLDDLSSITPDQAAAHPRWRMGRKISIDSATLMNKAFELCEACWLFGRAPEEVQVVIHPQSIVHGMVSESDGCLFMHAAVPDMALPIQYAILAPERGKASFGALFSPEFGSLSLGFEELDNARFPAISLARECLRRGGNEGLIFHTANEVAVEQFEHGALSFDRIVPFVADALERFAEPRASSSEELLEQLEILRRKLSPD